MASVTFLGGAGEVGASCALVELAGGRVLVDCGIHMGREDRLPDLGRLQPLSGPSPTSRSPLDAIVITHAHLDHSGALPLVSAAFPETPIYCTAPTRHLIQILLLDALHVMESRLESEGELPLYARPAVEAALGRVQEAAFLDAIDLAGGALRATLAPAGHILGAATVTLESEEGTLFFSGDVSAAEQLTVPGLLVPRARPQAAVVESTYGDRLHANRAAEERRLAQDVAAVVTAGGRVLIPAFALGRAQEVLLILRRAQERGDIARFPIYVDGMVRHVCAAYLQYPEHLTPRLRREVERLGNAFAPADGPGIFVSDSSDRESVLNSREPACIVSSSGMLSGGPSVAYAARLATEAGSAIFITGYQDEESPGRRLLELAERLERGDPEPLRVQGRLVEVRCAVRRYALSAHADSGEIAGLLAALRPSEVALVHGEPAAAQALAHLLVSKDSSTGAPAVHLPRSGDTIEFHPRSRRRGGRRGEQLPPVPASSRPRLSPSRPLPDQAGLGELYRTLLARGQRAYSVQDLAQAWYATSLDAIPLEAANALRAALVANQLYFRPDERRPYLYRLRSEDDVARLEERVLAGRMEQNAALAQVDTLFPLETGLYRKGYHLDTWTLTLYFQFPQVAPERYAAELDKLRALTGWQVEVSPEPHQGALMAAVSDVLPSGWALMRPASVHREQGIVRARVAPARDLPSRAAALEQAQEVYRERTGFQLEWEIISPALDRAPESSSLPSVPLAALAPLAPLAPLLRSPDQPLEINAALAEIERAAAAAGPQLYRKSKKADPHGDYIELSFITPEVGRRHQDLLDDLAARTGWRITINPHPQQQAVQQAARALIPLDWGLLRDPSLHVGRRQLVVRLARTPAADELATVATAVQDQTGYELVVG